MPNLEKIAKITLADGTGKLWQVRKPEEPAVAAIYQIKFKNTITYLAGANSEKGMETDALSFLLFKVLQAAASENMIFDFEGSMIESIESSFRGFGASPIPYLNIYRNRLPLFLRWIRK